MDAPYQTYYDNLNIACGLVKPLLTPDMSEQQVIDIVRSNAERLFRIHQENDEILEEILFSKKAETLSQEEAFQLLTLADKLFQYNRSADTGIAHRIHKLLYAYAQHHNDLDLIIRELYYQGITLLYLGIRDPVLGNNIYVEEIGAYFQAGASYISQYEQITNSQTRAYIVRCLGNVKYGLKNLSDNPDSQNSFLFNDRWDQYMECFCKTMAIVQSPYYREMNPEIPWDTFVYSMHYDRTQFLTGLRQIPNSSISKAVLESAEYVYRHQEQLAKTKDIAIGVGTRYVYAAARYHAGEATIDELMDVLFEICESADPHDFSSDTIWAILYTPEYLMHYSQELPPSKQQAIRPRLKKAADQQKEFLFLLPKNEYAAQVSRTLQTVTKYSSSQDINFYHQILDYILACHPPTFIHSKMVALLARHFCEKIIDVKPELLFDSFGLGEIKKGDENAEKLPKLVYDCGLYHDLGKCMLLNYIGLYSRKLLDEEFACIKLHPAFGCSLLETFRMEDMSKVAHYHHRSYNGTGGYPCSKQDCPASIRRIVSLITIVDSLDAGTDNIGRSYAAAKSYEQLVEELRAGQGTRYDPDIVKLLDDPVFYQQTKQLLAHCRRQIYLEAYPNKH